MCLGERGRCRGGGERGRCNDGWVGAEPDDVPGSAVVADGGCGCIGEVCGEGCVGGCGCLGPGGNRDAHQSTELIADELDDDDDDEEDDARSQAPRSGVFSSSGSSRE